MTVGNVTTPFGRRPMTLALVRGQLETADIPAEKTVDKWRVYRDLCEARSLLGLRDRALAVLNALLSFYPDPHLSAEDKLIVFPSNSQLSLRANGIAGTTLRENLALLVKAGVIHRKDSPNGKRYARKDGAGAIDDAFGFSLAPLLARSEEFALLAQQVAADRRHTRLLKEKISILRRDVRKLISAAMDEYATGDWIAAEADYLGLVGRLPAAKSDGELRELHEGLEMLQTKVLNLLQQQLKIKKTDGNDSEYRHHIQNSNTDSINELEPRLEKKQGETVPDRVTRPNEPVKAFPLSMVLRACKEIANYGPGGNVSNWRDLMSAAIVTRSMLGVSPSAYEEACDVMGAENAAVAMACILERAGHINSAGGYLRSLTRRAARGEFSLGPMLMALARTRCEASAKAS